jgi:hypothetical protein
MRFSADSLREAARLRRFTTRLLACSFPCWGCLRPDELDEAGIAERRECMGSWMRRGCSPIEERRSVALGDGSSAGCKLASRLVKKLGMDLTC